MWLWLRKRLPRYLTLWSKLAAYVGGLHLIVLFALFFVYQGDNHSFSFTLNRHIDLSAAVVFLPLQKRAGIANQAGGAQKAADGAEQPVAKKVEEKTPKAAKVKPAKATTCIALTTPKKKVKVKDKKSKKTVAQKKALPVEEKKEEPKKEIAPEPKKMEELALLATTTDVAHANVGFENVQYLGQLDLQALEMEQAVNSEIQQHWTPPPGISNDAVCEVNILVSWEGAVNFTIENPSGIAMYDVSVRSAMMKVTFPKQLWGKSFSITFKQ